MYVDTCMYTCIQAGMRIPYMHVCVHTINDVELLPRRKVHVSSKQMKKIGRGQIGSYTLHMYGTP